MAHFGKLDILVNNAAIAVQGKTVDDPGLDTVNLDRQWQINVMGAVATTRAAAPVLTDGGRIIFIGSLLGTHVPFPGVADYAGTKAAIVGYAKGVARDLGGRNITVNVIQPGVMPTDMSADVLGMESPSAHGSACHSPDRDARGSIRPRLFSGGAERRLHDRRRDRRGRRSRYLNTQLRKRMTKLFGAKSTADEVLSGVDLEGKRIFITGVSSGIGLETARSLVAHGASVVGTVRISLRPNRSAQAAAWS